MSALDAGADDDHDGLSNVHEFLVDSFPTNGDSDHDGLPDAWEVEWALDPASYGDAALDSDNDGDSNLVEFNTGSNPLDDRMTPAELMYLVPIIHQHSM